MSDHLEAEGQYLNPETITQKNEQNIILVTGGSGLVGSTLIKLLLRNGENIKAIYRQEIPNIEGKENVTWIKADILDVVSLEEAMKDVEYVYHCAAIVSFNAKRKNELFQTNVAGTANVVNACLASTVKKLCFVSSVAAFGKSKRNVEINEKTTWSEASNSSNYGKSKYLAEIEVWRGIAEGLDAVIVNPSIVLGPGDWSKGSTKIFKTAYEEFQWFTEGVTGFVDVKDVARAMIQLMNSSIANERFILSGYNKNYKEVFTMAALAFQKKPPVKKVSRLMAGIVWRAEAVKSLFTNEDPLVTKETAQAAQEVVYFDNSKLNQFLPSFTYTPFNETIKSICSELKEKNKLK